MILPYNGSLGYKWDLDNPTFKLNSSYSFALAFFDRDYFLYVSNPLIVHRSVTKVLSSTSPSVSKVGIEVSTKVHRFRNKKTIVKPWPQTLSPKPLVSKPKPKGLGLTLKSHGPPPHPTPATARGRTWSSPPCSLRTSSILLVAPLSKSSIRGGLIQDQMQVYLVDKNMVEQSSTVP